MKKLKTLWLNISAVETRELEARISPEIGSLSLSSDGAAAPWPILGGMFFSKSLVD